MIRRSLVFMILIIVGCEELMWSLSVNGWTLGSKDGICDRWMGSSGDFLVDIKIEDQ